MPVDVAGHGKVIVAFVDGSIPAGTLRALRDLGVEAQRRLVSHLYEVHHAAASPRRRAIRTSPASPRVSSSSRCGWRHPVVFSAGDNGPEPGTIGGYHDPRNGAVLVGAACTSVDSSRCEKDQQIVDVSSRGAADGTGPQVDVVAPTR